ncbi:hypothetical protein [Streptomyces sp. IBSBF 2435]|uniref:hypothetical protein n=1 Tax=Streptomyces sp. IBSBF 2435 TaxID=2903531 RepID=UPI002FDBB679
MGGYGRRLAVAAASVGGEIGFLEERRPAGPDAAVRGHALKASLRLPVADAALERTMDDAPAAVRRQIAAVVIAGAHRAGRAASGVGELRGDRETAAAAGRRRAVRGR